MIDPLDDIAREGLEDRAIELTPHSELPCWPPNVVREPSSPSLLLDGGGSLTTLREALEIFAEAAATPSNREEPDD